MSDSCFGSVIWSLWLWNVDNGTRHATDEHYASWSLSLHQVFCDRNCEEICTIHIDAPKLSDTINWVVDSLEVLGKPSGRDKVVNLAVLCNDICDSGIDRFWGGDISVMCSDLWDTVN
jgi:hypothetical protein